MKKIAAFASVLALAACAAPPPPPQNFPPLDYSYLKPIVFNVATLNVVDNYTPSPAEIALNANNPAPPATTLLAMLNRRLQPSGTPGAGTVTVQVASITEANGRLNGQMTVDINLSSPDGRATGFAEASVSATASEPDTDADPNAQQAALYQMTKKLMDTMNVELPYQIAHNIPNWVSWTNPQGAMSAPVSDGTVPGGIQAAPLAAPPGSGGPAMPIAPTAPMSTNTNPAVPNYLPGAGPAALSQAP